jgi:hypothetical protein
LVQAAARATLLHNRIASTVAERIKKRLTELYPRCINDWGDFISDNPPVPHGEQLMPHLLARPPSEILTILLQAGLSVKEKTAFLLHLNVLAFFLGRNGDWAGSVLLYEGGLAREEKLIMGDPMLRSVWLNNLALAHERTNNFVTAKSLRERLLADEPDPESVTANNIRADLARVLLVTDQPLEALTLGKTALTAHYKAFGRDHDWTKESARVTADALDALGRAEEAKALRERYGITQGGRDTSTDLKN